MSDIRDEVMTLEYAGSLWVAHCDYREAERAAWNAAIEAAAQRMRQFIINDTALPESLIRDISESIRALRKGEPT